MKRNQIIALSLSAMVGIGSLAGGLTASASVLSDKIEGNKDIVVCNIADIDAFENMTFEDHIKGFELKELSAKDREVLKTMYNETIQLEKNSKYDLANKKWDAFYSILDKYMKYDKFEMTEGKYEAVSFDDFIKELELKEVTAQDQVSLKKIYEEMTQLEKNNKFEEANKKWDELFKILDKYMEFEYSYVDMSFEEFMKGMDLKEITAKDQASLKALYEEVTKLEKDKKYEKANKKWNDLYNILDQYMKYEKIDMTFEELIKATEIKELSAKDKTAAKTIYEQVVELEKNDKYEEANKKWDELYTILDQYKK